MKEKGLKIDFFLLEALKYIHSVTKFLTHHFTTYYNKKLLVIIVAES